ncbi:MAG: aspartyl-tRNA(Asn)/glutamyl-tRNA (Gln) amidotransferase subunit A [Bacillota bacterium]|nr:MAG: aspartyl-tRNA(Asn)/glutamyl-tRNA (Gln) amidotransferase subunit A [Bacillota bacterium]
MKIYELNASEIHKGLRHKDFSAREVAQAHLYRIEQTDKDLKAFVTVTTEQALRAADAVDAKMSRGEELHPLSGIPVAVKDNMCTTGVKTTCSSKMLESFVPPYTATVVNKLEQAGAVVLGKTNLDEFAMGSSTENSAFFTTRNPYDLERVPGGSSGGSAVAVAAGQAVIALGSDTGGSIRQPAAFCGIVGVKPTYSLVSRYGLVAFASSLDQVGPFARTVSDAAWALEALAGHDPLDSTSVPNAPVDWSQPLDKGIRGLKVGVPREYFADGMEPAVVKSVREAIKVFECLGAEISEISLPHTSYALPTYYIIAPAEASSNLARFDGVRYGFRAEGATNQEELISLSRSQGFGPEVKRRIMLGTYALSNGYYDAYYGKAQKVRSLIKQDFDNAFSQVDIILSPTSPTTAFKVGARVNDPLSMYMADLCTFAVNLAGIPALSLNCGFVEGLPVGLQLMGKAFSEMMLLQAAFAYEQTVKLPQLPVFKGGLPNV